MRSRESVTWWAVVSAGLSPVLLVAGWLVADALQPASYSPLRQSVSVAAGLGGTDRWIMTGALFAVGCAHLVTAAGMRGVHVSARVILVVAGAAAIGVAASPEPVHGSTPQHLAWTALGAVTIAVWPVFIGTREAHGSPVLGIRGSAITAAIFVVLLGWLFAETQGGTALGLAERVTASIQTTWPFVVALALWRTTRRGWTDEREPTLTVAEEAR